MGPFARSTNRALAQKREPLAVAGQGSAGDRRCRTARGRKIEQRIAEGNPPQVIEQAKKTHAAFVSFKEWLAERAKARTHEPTKETDRFPTFREWFTERESHVAEGT